MVQRKETEGGEYCIVGSVVTCNHGHVLLRWSY